MVTIFWGAVVFHSNDTNVSHGSSAACPPKTSPVLSKLDENGAFYRDPNKLLPASYCRGEDKEGGMVLGKKSHSQKGRIEREREKKPSRPVLGFAKAWETPFLG